MKSLLLSLLAVFAVVGCSSEPAAVEPAPAGKTSEAEVKGGASKAQGMSSSDLTVPAGSENANLPGSKTGG